VDDSALMRRVISEIIQRDPHIQVVGTAMDGIFALQKIEELNPQVVTLDLEMPRMNGIEALQIITRKYRVPVIIVSGCSTESASLTCKALLQGAFDFVAKPRQAASDHMEDIAQELISKIKVAAERGVPVAPLEPSPAPPYAEKAARVDRTRFASVVAIGVSTGGPSALLQVLSGLPPDFPGTILIVQHMVEGFTEMFARRLNECCAIDVGEAQPADPLLAGRALICPGNRHLKVRRLPRGGLAVLAQDEPVNGHRPSADVLFRSVAQEFGGSAVGVLMTGMGEDGAEGLGELKRAGGMTIVQNEESCVVFGMPKAAIDRGHASRVLPLEALAGAIQAHCAFLEGAAVLR